MKRIDLSPPGCVRVTGSLHHGDHPAHAEAVGDHAEAPRKEGPAQGHPNLATLRETVEKACCLRLIRSIERDREPLKVRAARASTIRRHHSRAADLKARMHDLVLASRRSWISVVGWIGAILPTQHHPDLGADSASIELDRFLATAFKEQIGFDPHGSRLLVKACSFTPGGAHVPACGRPPQLGLYGTEARFGKASRRSRCARVPRSRPPPSSMPSRKTVCSVKVNRAPSLTDRSSTVASENEIRLLSRSSTPLPSAPPRRRIPVRAQPRRCVRSRKWHAARIFWTRRTAPLVKPSNCQAPRRALISWQIWSSSLASARRARSRGTTKSEIRRPGADERIKIRSASAAASRVLCVTKSTAVGRDFHKSSSCLRSR